MTAPDDDEGRMLVSPGFWIGGALAVLMWVGFVRWVLEFFGRLS